MICSHILGLSRKKIISRIFCFTGRALIVISVAVGYICAQSSPAPKNSWTELASFHYGIAADVVYGNANNTPLRLDVWQNLSAKRPVPTLMYIHGGGWMIGDKEGATNLFLPYIERGWNVVNVEYRLGGNSLAPAAVEDSRCALRWIYNNAAKYHFDLNRIVASGHSAGGHLALMMGMLPNGTDLDSECPADADSTPLKVAAVVDWFGITDVDDLLQGPDRETYAVAWVGSGTDKHAIAREVSPLTYVRKELPPIIIVHGDHDPTVPYSQAVRLNQALNDAHAPHELVTIPGGSHGGFSDQQTLRAFSEIWSFLKAHGLDTDKYAMSPDRDTPTAAGAH